MPLVVHPRNYAAWIDPSTEEPADLLEPFDDGRMEAYPVSTQVNDPKNDSPALLQPLGERFGM
jgi:putative SOS response-associated peptidase YedK